MRVRKVAKQLKLFRKNVKFDEDGYPICKYRVANLVAKTNYILRMTRRNYFGLATKYGADSMMGRLYIHKACSPYLYEEILSFWGMNLVFKRERKQVAIIGNIKTNKKANKQKNVV